MARRIPENRLKELLDCATDVFISAGYRRAQMADVASAMGVAKGTVYLYVESKEALFEAVMLYAGGRLPELADLELPIAARPGDTLVATLREALAQEAAPRALRRAVEGGPVADASSELEEIIRELFELANRNCTLIELVDRCARDRPDLAEVFYEGGRRVQLDLLARYLTERIAQGQLRAVPDPIVAARLIIETVATWAIHIRWDPAPQAIDPAVAQDTVVHFLLGGLIEEQAS